MYPGVRMNSGVRMNPVDKINLNLKALMNLEFKKKLYQILNVLN